jgi:hypothetical protein
MDAILEAAELEARFQRIEEALYKIGALERPVPPAPPVEPRLVPRKILVQPFRGAAAHPYSVYFEFDSPYGPYEDMPKYPEVELPQITAAPLTEVRKHARKPCSQATGRPDMETARRSGRVS